jgi:hypothetical protein
MELLSDELMLVIFSSLHHFDLVTVGRVSKQWLRVSRDNREWKRRFCKVHENASKIGYYADPTELVRPSNSDFFSDMMKRLKVLAFAINAFLPEGENAYLYFLSKAIDSTQKYDEKRCVDWWVELARIKPDTWGPRSAFFKSLMSASGSLHVTYARDLFRTCLRHSMCSMHTLRSLLIPRDDLIEYSPSSSYASDSMKLYLYASHYSLQDVKLYCVYRCIRYVWDAEVHLSKTTERMEDLESFICCNELDVIEAIRDNHPEPDDDTPYCVERLLRPYSQWKRPTVGTAEVIRRVRAKFRA